MRWIGFPIRLIVGMVWLFLCVCLIPVIQFIFIIFNGKTQGDWHGIYGETVDWIIKRGDAQSREAEQRIRELNEKLDRAHFILAGMPMDKVALMEKLAEEGWTDVNMGLPKETSKAWWVWDEGWGSGYEAFYDDGGWNVNEQYHEPPINITHFRPLPSPPRSPKEPNV